MIECRYCNDDVPKETYCLLHWYPDPYCSRDCFLSDDESEKYYHSINKGLVQGPCIMEYDYCKDATKCPNYEKQSSHSDRQRSGYYKRKLMKFTPLKIDEENRTTEIKCSHCDNKGATYIYYGPYCMSICEPCIEELDKKMNDLFDSFFGIKQATIKGN